MTSMTFVSQLTKLTVLNLGFNHITDLSPLSEIRSLAALILNNNNITVVSGIHQLVRLNTLILSHNKITDIDVATLSQLAKLQLSHNRLQAFPDVRFNTELKILLLNDNKIKKIPPDCLGQNCRLKIVEVGSNAIKKMKSLKSLSTVKSLVHLNMLGNDVCSRPEFVHKVIAFFPRMKILNSQPVHKLVESAKQESDQRPVKRKRSSTEHSCEVAVEKTELSDAALKPKKRKKIKEKKQKVLKTAEKLCDIKTTFPEVELPDVETGLDSTIKVSRKKVKAQKKLKSLPDSGLLTEALDCTAVTATESERSVIAASDLLSPVKRLPAKSDHNSGVVRVVEKSRHKRVQRTDNIEEALQLDVGSGSCQW